MGIIGRAGDCHFRALLLDANQFRCFAIETGWNRRVRIACGQFAVASFIYRGGLAARINRNDRAGPQILYTGIV